MTTKPEMTIKPEAYIDHNGDIRRSGRSTQQAMHLIIKAWRSPGLHCSINDHTYCASGNKALSIRIQGILDTMKLEGFNIVQVSENSMIHADSERELVFRGYSLIPIDHAKEEKKET